MLTKLIVCHIIGDFLLQNHWMQQKSKNTVVCLVHILCYSLPFIAFCHQAGCLVLGLILTEHFLQDRFGLHLKWMAFYRQTTPDKWPVGPLFMDQAWHIAFIFLIQNFLGK